MTLKLFFEIENSFERGIFSHSDASVDFYLKSLQHFHEGRFDEFYRRMEERLVQIGGLEKGCCLIWMILVSESQYDLDRRHFALKQFHREADENYQQFFEYYRMLFKAVGYAYQSLQIEALACYTRSMMLAEMMNYSRGTVRSLTGIGLIHKELNNNREANAAFKKALYLTQINGFNRAASKLSSLLDVHLEQDHQKVSVENRLLSEKNLIIKLINENDFVFARRRIIEAELLRRRSGVKRRAHSFYVWSAIVSGLIGKMKTCYRVLSRLDDRILKSQALKILFEKGFILSAQMQNEMKIIDIEFFGQTKNETIDLNQIKNVNVCAVLKILSESLKPMTKADLFQHVFGINYDPVIHDAKLYKLILQTRKQVGPEVVVNHHGTYSFNRKFKFVD